MPTSMYGLKAKVETYKEHGTMNIFSGHFITMNGTYPGFRKD